MHGKLYSVILCIVISWLISQTTSDGRDKNKLYDSISSPQVHPECAPGASGGPGPGPGQPEGRAVHPQGPPTTGNVTSLSTGMILCQRPYIRETMHSALNLIIIRAQLISTTRGHTSQPKVLAMATDCSATCQQG